MTTVRQPAVAGKFYPTSASELRTLVTRYLDEAKLSGARPKAIIVPHAGYVYSGPVAATAYTHLAQVADSIRRVVLLGPSHFVAFQGLAASSADAFATPLGTIPVDTEAVHKALALDQVHVIDLAHAEEHSLEVQLPFLQSVLRDFSLVPLLVGEATAEEVAQVVETLWGGQETVIAVSSDLSHFHDYQTANRLDRATSLAIEKLDWSCIGHDQACGYRAIDGMLCMARHHGLQATTLDVRNSGDTGGTFDRVVGYGAYAFE